MPENFTEHELKLMAEMTPQHKALMEKLTPKERQSLQQNVKTPADVELIQSWIRSDEEIEEVLFWDRGGKFDDPEWRHLKPADESTRGLFNSVNERYAQLRKASVELQRRSDLTLLSQFIAPLLFSGVAGAVRCDQNGRPDIQGRFFKGVELRCIGSVAEQINSLTIYPVGGDEFEVHYGSRVEDQGRGIWVYTGDSYSLLGLAQLLNRTLSKTDFQTALVDKRGNPVGLDPKVIRKAAMESVGLDYDDELRLFASARAKGVDAAIDRAVVLQESFYQRFGLEVECYKIGKKYGNFVIMREDNFDRYLANEQGTQGLVMLTATLVCRRCRRELKDFADFAKTFPNVTFALVNLSSPQFKFYERVFAEMSGGDVDNFRKTAVGVTPFVIIYTPEKSVKLAYREYLSTGKAEAPPDGETTIAVLNRFFG